MAIMLHGIHTCTRWIFFRATNYLFLASKNICTADEHFHWLDQRLYVQLNISSHDGILWVKLLKRRGILKCQQCPWNCLKSFKSLSAKGFTSMKSKYCETHNGNEGIWPTALSLTHTQNLINIFPYLQKLFNWQEILALQWFDF